MNKPSEIKYVATATSKGGRAGTSKSDDGRLDVMLSTPAALGGDDGQGTNPEQLFAAGYSACFIGATKFVAGQEGITLPDDFEITGKVGIGPIEGGFSIDVDLNISMPGMDKAQAQDLIEKAHKVCPYSNATRGNIEVRLNLV